MNPLIQTLSGVEVIWDGTDAGLMPELIGYVPDTIHQLDEATVRYLIDILSRADLFVAAHVILTRLSGVVHETFPEWNGLKVNIAADGSVTIDPEQRYELAKRWKRYFETEPRPNMLPT